MQVYKCFEAMQIIYVLFYLYARIARFNFLSFKIMDFSIAMQSSYFSQWHLSSPFLSLSLIDTNVKSSHGIAFLGISKGNPRGKLGFWRKEKVKIRVATNSPQSYCNLYNKDATHMDPCVCMMKLKFRINGTFIVL